MRAELACMTGSMSQGFWRAMHRSRTSQATCVLISSVAAPGLASAHMAAHRSTQACAAAAVSLLEAHR